MELFGDLFKTNFLQPKAQKVVVTEEEKQKSLFEKYGPDEVLFKWSYEGKLPNAQYSPRFLRMLMIVGIAVGVLLALMQDFILILAIGSVVFFYYVLHNKYVPGEVFYGISKYGFRYGSKIYYWGDLRNFFFSKRGNTEILIFEVVDDLLGRIVVLFRQEDREKIFELLKDRVLYVEKEPKNLVDNFVDFVSDKFNTDAK